MRKYLSTVRRGAAVVGLTAGGLAMAQSGSGFDVSSVTTQITAATVAIGAIGAAVVAGPAVVKATWKWIRSAI